MSITQDTTSPDSLQTLIQKVNAIITVNTENLSFIESRKGQKVILQNQLVLQMNEDSQKKRKVTSKNNNDTPYFSVVNNTITSSIDDLIEDWRYEEEPLSTETIAFDKFLDLKLNTYEDLVRLNRSFEELSEKYARVLTDQPETKVAFHGVLGNVEKLQIAIGEVHALVLDVRDPLKDNEKVKQQINNMSRGFRLLQNELPQLQLNLMNKVEDMDTGFVSFVDVKQISCKVALSSDDCDIVCSLQNYCIEGRHCLASGHENGNIGLWDLYFNSKIGTLTGHSNVVCSLATYTVGKIQMLASGSWDWDIKIWDLKNRSLVHTLSDHSGSVYSLKIGKTNYVTLLISGGEDKIIRLHDVNNFSLMTVLKGHSHAVGCLEVYSHGDEFYLASVSDDNTIILWNIADNRFIAKLSGHESWINSLKFISYHSKNTLASFDLTGCLKLWNLKNYNCVGSVNFEGSENPIEIIQCEHRKYLVIASKALEIWDFSSKRIKMKLESTCSRFRSLKAFVCAGESIIATGDVEGNIKLWKE